MHTLYHAHEISLEGPDAEIAALRPRLVEAFPASLKIASLHHGRDALEQPEEDGRIVDLDLAGTRTRWQLPTHPDPSLAGNLCAWADLALVQGTTSPGAHRVVWCDGETPIEAMRGVIALVGNKPPARTPPGGLPYFASTELEALALHLEDSLVETLRSRPVLGLVAGARTAEEARDLSGLLEGLVEQSFAVAEVATATKLPSWLRPVTRTLAGAGYVGDLLAAASALPGAALLVVSGREGDGPVRLSAERVLEGRSALRDATALRGTQDSLPRNGAVLWEAKGLARLWHFLGGGVRCPQRILNQCRVELLEP